MMQHPLQNVWRTSLWQRISYQIFKTSLVLSILSITVESIEPGFVANWFNPLWFIAVLLVSGFMATYQGKNLNV